METNMELMNLRGIYRDYDEDPSPAALQTYQREFKPTIPLCIMIYCRLLECIFWYIKIFSSIL